MTEPVVLAHLLVPLSLFSLLLYFAVLLLACLREPSRTAEANQQAAALLEEVLSEAERQQLNRLGYLAIPSPSRANRVYRVPACQGPVHVYEGDRLIMSLCVQPAEPLPAAEVVLVHKLMIQGNEQEYLNRANTQRTYASIS